MILSYTLLRSSSSRILSLFLSLTRIHIHSFFLSLFLTLLYIYIICQYYIFNRYTHSHIKYRGKYIDKVLIYLSHVIGGDPAKTRLSFSLSISLPLYTVSLFTDRPFAMHPIVPIGKLSDSTS